jgi:hypothetical protein
MIVVSVIDNIPYSHLIPSYASIKIGFNFKFCFRNEDYPRLLSFFAFMSRTQFVVLDDMEFQIPAGARNFFSKTYRLALGPTQPSTEWVLSSMYTGRKVVGNCGYYSHPTSAEFKSDWSHTSTLTKCLCDVYRDSLTVPVPGCLVDNNRT